MIFTVEKENIKFGWVRQNSDARDYSLKHEAIAPHLIAEGAVPTSFDLRNKDSAIEDQGNFGACTSFAGAAIMQYYYPGKNYSELFIYFWNRYVDSGGNLSNYNPKYAPTEDCGSTIRSTMKVLAKLGDCFEATWPYVGTNLNQKPSDVALAEADDSQVTKYGYVTENSSKIANTKRVVASGIPVMFGSEVANSVFDVGIDGIEPYDTNYVGGHARVIVGYDDSKVIKGTKTKGAFIVRNSWNASWGMSGYSWVSYQVFIDQQTDNMYIISAEAPIAPTPEPTPSDDWKAKFDQLVADIKKCLPS